METQVLENIKNLENTNELNMNIIEKIYDAQKAFLETDIGKAVNTAVDIGIKAVLPDLIEDEIIDIKDAILENGFKEGIKEIINSGIDFGKSISGIITGKFETIEQVQIAVRNGGILDKTSDLLDYAIKFANEKGL